KISESPSRFSPRGSSLYAKAARAPSRESAGAGPRAGASSLKETCAEVSEANAEVCDAPAEVSDATTWKPPRAPAAARSALDSKTTREPSPLSVGLRFKVSAEVSVRRRTDSFCERTPVTSRQSAAAKMRAIESRLAREVTVVLLCLSRVEV